MKEGLAGPQSNDGTDQTKVSMARAETGATANITAALTAAEANNPGSRNKSPHEGGRGCDDEIAWLRQDNLEMRIRMEVQAEVKTRMERAQLEKLQLGYGGVQSSEKRAHSGTCSVGLGMPAPKLDSKVGSSFT